MPSQHRSDPGSGSSKSRYPGTFMLAFREALAALGWKVGRWLGDAVECTDAQGRDQVVGLENLFRRARRIERAEWPELITEFLQTSQQGPIDDPPEDLTEVADKLLVRLGPPMAIRGPSPELWQQEIGDTGLVISLVVDFPKTMFYVTAELVASTGKAGEEWLAQALANLQKTTSADNFKVIHDESGLRQCCVGDAYDASRALLLDTLMPEASKYGHFVAIPGRDELLALPVTKISLAFIPLLKMIASKSHRSAPYPISDDVYWIKDGQWRRFLIHLKDKQANVQPPSEFLPILQELMPEGEGATGEMERDSDN